MAINLGERSQDLIAIVEKGPYGMGGIRAISKTMIIVVGRGLQRSSRNRQVLNKKY